MQYYCRGVTKHTKEKEHSKWALLKRCSCKKVLWVKTCYSSCVASTVQILRESSESQEMGCFHCYTPLPESFRGSYFWEPAGQSHLSGEMKPILSEKHDGLTPSSQTKASRACIWLIWGSGRSFGGGDLSWECLSSLSPHCLRYPASCRTSKLALLWKVGCGIWRHFTFRDVQEQISRVHQAHLLSFRFMKLTFILKPLGRTGTDVHLSYCNYLSVRLI